MKAMVRGFGMGRFCSVKEAVAVVCCFAAAMLPSCGEGVTPELDNNTQALQPRIGPTGTLKVDREKICCDDGKMSTGECKDSVWTTVGRKLKCTSRGESFWLWCSEVEKKACELHENEADGENLHGCRMKNGSADGTSFWYKGDDGRVYTDNSLGHCVNLVGDRLETVQSGGDKKAGDSCKRINDGCHKFKMK